MVGDTCLLNLGPIAVGSETCRLNLGPIGVRPKEGSLGTIMGPLEAILVPLGTILGPLVVISVPCLGLLVPVGLFWRRLAWLKLAPRRGEKQICTIVRFAISIALNIDLGTPWTRFWASQEAQELPKSVLEAMLGPPWGLSGSSWGLLENLGPSWDRPGAILGPSWVLLVPF